jgi:hypothetical protein
MTPLDRNGTRFKINNESNNSTEKTNEETDLYIYVSISESFNTTFDIISLG